MMQQNNSLISGNVPQSFENTISAPSNTLEISSSAQVKPTQKNKGGPTRESFIISLEHIIKNEYNSNSSL